MCCRCPDSTPHDHLQFPYCPPLQVILERQQPGCRLLVISPLNYLQKTNSSYCFIFQITTMKIRTIKLYYLNSCYYKTVTLHYLTS